MVAIPTTLLGGTFPLLAQWLGGASGGGARRWVGRLYALNTAGAVLGAGAAGYLLLPALGNRRTLLLAAATSAVANVGRTEDGWELAARLVARHPDDAEALLLAGLAAARLGRAAESVALLERAVARDPAGEAARLALATARRLASRER